MDRPHWLDDPEKTLSEIEQVLRPVAQVGGSVALLLHPEAFSVNSAWFDLFERILDVCEKLGARTGDRLDEVLTDCDDASSVEHA
jgi:hypothetical protein